MNESSRDVSPECPSSATLHRIADGTLPPSDEEAIVAHLNACPACRQKLETIGESAGETIQGLRRIHDRLSEVGMEQLRAKCIPPLSDWEGCNGDAAPVSASRLRSSRDRRPHERLGRFEIVGKLGRGGMGVVHEGFDPELQRSVAIKVMKSEISSDPSAGARFLREARSAARLQHPNVVTIHEVSTSAEPWFIVMEYVRGKSLSSVIDGESCLKPSRAARITLEVLAALAHAHDQGIIHRDVKPSNVLLDARTETAKLADFGLARGIDEVARYTAEGSIVGTAWYIAPEQAAGVHRLDGRCDLFSTGVMLFEMLTGVLPFPGRDSREVVRLVCHEPAPDPRTSNPCVPAELARTIGKALQKKPSARYQTAAEFAGALHGYLAKHQAAAEESTELWGPHETSEDGGVIAALLEVTQSEPPFQGRIWIQRCAAGLTRDILTVTRDNRDCCRIGERFSLQVQADVDCRVTLLDVGTSGNVCVLLLNHPIRGGEVATLSGPDDSREWIVGGPPGIERIKALFTREPLAFPMAKPFSSLAACNRSRDIVTRIKQVGVALEEMPPHGWTDATCHFVIEPQ